MIKVKVKVTQCSILCDLTDYTVHGILQARILEWVAFPFSRGSSQPRDWTQVSHIAGRFFTSWATKEAKAPTLWQQPALWLEPVSTSGQSQWSDAQEKRKQTAPPTGSAQLKQWWCVPDRVVSASLGPLHDWHPLVVIAKERQVKVRAATVGLGADGELAQQPANGLRVSSVLGVDNSVFKPEIKHQGGRLC